ncbi:unnamed protein product [Caenorhabditis angaria]|uniref:Uncharacterized protein n=1 Tax=Caenorhabditis angaria TaxID=860376 RepID=A0A9P1ISR4_9PELO|nr:unnamed protein product [Caenorhabditis angaria]
MVDLDHRQRNGTNRGTSIGANFGQISEFRGKLEEIMRQKLGIFYWLWIFSILEIGKSEILIDNDYNLSEDPMTVMQEKSMAKMQKMRKNCTRQPEIIDKLLNGTGYNKFRIPNDGVEVTVDFWIQAITFNQRNHK